MPLGFGLTQKSNYRCSIAFIEPQRSDPTLEAHDDP
jgi:hypothetical protein